MLKTILNIIIHPIRSWRNLPKWSERGVSRNLQDFLPPSLEVLEKPPHPAPRFLLWVTILVFFVGIVWATVGKVDIITTAEGKIIPGGKVKVIQSLEKGVITKIMVTEGQLVKAGEHLVELDQTQTKAERIRVEREMEYAKHRLVRREILADWLKNDEDFKVTLKEAQDSLAVKGFPGDARLLLEEWLALLSDAQTLMSQLEERKAELKTSQVMIRQYQTTLPLVESRVSAIKILYEQKIVSKLDYLSLEEDHQRQIHALEAEKTREEQLTAAIVSVQKQIMSQRAKSLAETLSEIDDLSRQKLALTQELAKLDDIGEKQLLSSPVDGTIKGVMITTIGGVVNPAEVLMEVVPLGERLEVEAFIGNQDIGYVKEGQKAEVKIHTFPFTKYGLINAKVESVAKDATVDEKLGLIYRTRLSLERSSLMVDDVETPLVLGMGVTAEIATG